MQPVQGSQETPAVRFALDNTTQVKTSWGSRTVKILNLNTNEPQTIKLKELVNFLEEKIKSANTPQEIKSAREMFHTIKKIEGNTRSFYTKFLDFIGVKNSYDTKFAELEKKIEVPLLREDHQNELAYLKSYLIGLNEEALPKALKLVEDENAYNQAFRSHDMNAELTSASNNLKEIQKNIEETEVRILYKNKILEESFPEIQSIEETIGKYSFSPIKEEEVRADALTLFDQLLNVDSVELRLFAVEMFVKLAADIPLEPKEEAGIDFVNSLNNIPKDFPLKTKEDASLVKKKEMFIENLKPDSPIKLLLANKELQDLAKEMDAVMGNKDEDIAMQDFAHVIGINYPQRIREAIGDEGDFKSASVALILMQKNSSFINALKEMQEYNDTNGNFSQHPIETLPHLAALGMLDNVSKLKEQIGEIKQKLEEIQGKIDISTVDEVSDLYDQYNALLERQNILNKELEYNS